MIGKASHSGTISRRGFLWSSGAALTALGIAPQCVAVGAGPLGQAIGSQVWPMRSLLKDFPAFAKNIAGIGVRELELCSPLGYGEEFSSLTNGKEVKKILNDHGLGCQSSHFTMDELRKTPGKSLEWAHAVGVKQIITASLGDGNGGNHPSLEQVKKAAAEYNEIAAVSAKAGLQQGLHNEGFEMSIVEGKRTYDLLLDLLDPVLVKFQFQMSTITAGFVAADYFHKYPGRFFSMHLQDIDLNIPAGAGDEERPQVALGKGSIDWVKTFGAAKEGGVKNYFVEQSWALTQQSVAYLQTLNA